MKQSKKGKLLSLLLCFAMLLGMFPLTSAFAEENTQTIDSVSVRVTEPVDGEHPNFTITIAEQDPHYMKSKVTWYEDGESKPMTAEDTFEAGKQYEARFTVFPNEGYTLRQGEYGPDVFINGKGLSKFAPYGSERSGNNRDIIATFTASSLQPSKNLVNLAGDATIVGVSSYSSTYGETADCAFDGDEHLTKWCIQSRVGWVVFDIGKANIKQLEVFHAGAGTNETRPNNTKIYELQILDETKCSETDFFAKTAEEQNTIMSNGWYWKNISAVDGNTVDVRVSTVEMTGDRQLYRFHVSNAIRIYEIELLGENAGGSTTEPTNPTEPTQPSVNLAKNATIVGVSANSPNNNETAAHAFDGDEHLTKWCTVNGTGWVVFDIGTAAKINELKVFHAGEGTYEALMNNTTAFELQILDQTQVSEDTFLTTTGEQLENIMKTDGYWKNVCAVENNTASITENVCTDDTARVYRFHVSNAGEDNCIRIYEIELFEENAGGSTKPELPDAPTGVKAVGGDKSVTVSWDKVDTATSYEVYQYDGEKYIKVATTSDTIARVYNYDNDTTYKFAVKAVNENGASGFSTTATATTKASSPQQKTIDSISVKVTEPVVGEHPATTVEPVGNDVHYTVSAKWWSSSLTPYQWGGTS